MIEKEETEKIIFSITVYCYDHFYFLNYFSNIHRLNEALAKLDDEDQNEIESVRISILTSEYKVLGGFYTHPGERIKRSDLYRKE